MKTVLALACVAAAAAVYAPSGADAHGYMMVPKAKLASGDPTRYASEVRGSTILTVPADGSFSSSPQINVDSFTKAFKSSSFKTLRDLIEQKTPTGKTCGITPSGGDAQDLPTQVEWSSFTDSHVGPCEVWCDQTRVFQNDNCAGNYKTQPAKLPIDKAGCAGAKELRLYWLALHSQDWQIYVSCAPLKGTGSASAGGNTNSGGASTPAVTPAPSSARPSTPATTRPSTSPTTRPSTPATTRPSTGDNYDKGEVGGDAEADCDDELPVAGDDDCDDDLPVAGDDDCDDDLPVAGDDCDDDLPVAGDDKDEYGGESDNINFDALQRGTKYTPGKAKTN